jgi:hypothetical protein
MFVVWKTSSYSVILALVAGIQRREVLRAKELVAGKRGFLAAQTRGGWIPATRARMTEVGVRQSSNNNDPTQHSRWGQ